VPFVVCILTLNAHYIKQYLRYISTNHIGKYTEEVVYIMAVRSL